MHDSLDELSVLSLALQNREMNLPRADRLIRRSIRRIEHLKELTSLANSLRERLFTTTAADADLAKSNYTALVAKLAVLDPNYWPNEMHTNFGEHEVRKLCSRFPSPYADM